MLQMNDAPTPHATLAQLAHDMDALAASIATDAAPIAARWQGWIERPEFAPSAANLSHFLALRHHDLRDLQRRLMATGLSSLGRAESRILPTIAAVRRLLAAATGGAPEAAEAEDFFAGEDLIHTRADALLGVLTPQSPARLLVTLPSAAATDPSFVLRLARLGVEAMRINCAHDGEAAWMSMIGHVRQASAETGRRIRIMMDLPGPKIRTGAVRDGKDGHRLWQGDDLAIAHPGRLADVPRKLPAVECALPQAPTNAASGQRVFVDDGKLLVTVQQVTDWGLLARVDAGCDEAGYKLKPEKGLNFPDTVLQVPALTEEDRAILPFVARHADAIEYSFVQTVEDVADLQTALARAPR